jgi:hypothetical protein
VSLDPETVFLAISEHSLVKPDYFARLTLTGLSLKAVLRHYVDWVLGLGEFVRLRQRRLGLGVVAAWDGDALCAGAALDGANGCRACVQHRPPVVSVSLVHADESDSRIYWHSVTRLTPSNGAIVVEHAIGRTAPAGWTLEAIVTAPAALTMLLDREQVSVDPPQLRLAAPVTLSLANVPGFARGVLDGARGVPIALVAPPRRDPGIDAVRLARWLRSIAWVACLADDAALDAFNRALGGAGASELGCTLGAVRLYLPVESGDHPAWLAERISSFPPRRRENQLAAEITSAVSARTLPAEFLTPL